LATLKQLHNLNWLSKFLRFKDIKLLHSAIYLSDLNKCPENHAVWSLPYNSNIFKKSTKKGILKALVFYEDGKQTFGFV